MQVYGVNKCYGTDSVLNLWELRARVIPFFSVNEELLQSHIRCRRVTLRYVPLLLDCVGN